MALSAQGVTAKGGRNRNGGIQVFLQGGGPSVGFAFFVLLLSGARVGLCDASPNDTSTETVTRAFEAGQGAFSGGKAPLLLEVDRNGDHWSLTGYDRTGASLRRLTCLMCTNQEAAAAAAFLGDALGREYRGEGPAPVTIAGKDTTLSLGGVPVPLLRDEDRRPFEKAVRTDTPVRTRLAVVAAGLGISAFVIGGVFLWMDGACADSECAHFHELKGASIALLVTGAMLETAAILLWRLKRKPGARK